jgi:hypothetical protein
MKKSGKLAFIVLMILINHELQAQKLFKIELQSGSSLNGSVMNGGLFSNWGNGLIVGGGIAYHLFPNFDLVINVSYQYYHYQGDNLQFVNPDVLGFRRSVTGSGSNIIETSLAFRTSSPADSKIVHYFSFRTGVFRVNVGEINVASWIESTPELITRGLYPKTGVVEIKGFASLGIGFGVRLNSRLSTIIESQITQTFDLKQTFVPVVLIMQYNLKK